ncbi:MAG: hypothetical protein V1839_01370 [archaeon]
MAKKGQAALEYLSTYGWLLIIIVIVAAALYALGIFNPATYQGKSCTGFSTGITYIDHKLSSTGDFNFVASNGLGKTVTSVNNITITKDGTAFPDATMVGAITWTPGAKKTLNAVGVTNAGSVGNSYTVTVSINYDTSDVKAHIQTGTCTGTIE